MAIRTREEAMLNNLLIMIAACYIGEARSGKSGRGIETT